jgi:hypothetical protein
MSESEDRRHAALHPTETLDAGFSRRALLWLVPTIALSFLVAVILIAFGEGPPGDRSGRSSSFSRSALGHHALVGFLERSGVRVEVRRSRRAARGRAGTATFVIEPDPDLEDSAPKGYLREVVLSARRGGAPLLLVLPKWRAREVETLDGVVVRSAVLRPEIDVEAALDATGIAEIATLDVEREPTGNAYIPFPCATAWGEAADLELLSPQVLAPSPSLTPVVWSGPGQIVAKVAADPDSSDDTAVYVVSDPDILNNHGLARGDNALIVHRLIETCLSTDAVVLDEVVHGFGREEGLLAEALRFPLVVPVLQGAAVLLLVLWRGVGRFGKPLPAPQRLAAGKLELIHATAGLLGYRGRVVDSALAYFDETLAEVGRRFHVAAGAKGKELLSRLEKLSEERGIAMDLASLRNGLVSLSGSEVHVRTAAVRAACEIHRWHVEMLGEEELLERDAG